MIRRAAFVGLALQALVCLSLLTGCNLVGRSASDDAKRGAQLGGAIGGPAGAGIGAALMVVVGAIVRQREKRPLVKENAELRARVAALEGGPHARV